MRISDWTSDVCSSDLLVARQAERVLVLAVLELERQHAHADQVRTVDALEALDDDGADAEQVRALRRPVARRSGAIFLAADDDQRSAVRLVLHPRVVDRQDRTSVV